MTTLSETMFWRSITSVGSSQRNLFVLFSFLFFMTLLLVVEHGTGDLTGPSFACWPTPLLQLPSVCCVVCCCCCCLPSYMHNAAKEKEKEKSIQEDEQHAVV